MVRIRRSVILLCNLGSSVLQFGLLSHGRAAHANTRPRNDMHVLRSRISSLIFFGLILLDEQIYHQALGVKCRSVVPDTDMFFGKNLIANAVCCRWSVVPSYVLQLQVRYGPIMLTNKIWTWRLEMTK